MSSAHATGDKETELTSWETLAFLWFMVKLLLGTRSPFCKTKRVEIDSS